MTYQSFDLIIKPAVPADAAELLEIYRPYVENTAITFEYAVPTLKEFKKRIETTLQRYPYIIVRSQANNKALGYAYASAFKERAAYNYSVETSIYVQQDERRRGLGRILYRVLESLLQAQHVINVNSCIAFDATAGHDEHLNNNSVYFHESMGYTQCARFHRCGYKFGQWYDMVWMEKMLGEHPDKPELFIPFAKLEGVRTLIAAAQNSGQA